MYALLFSAPLCSAPSPAPALAMLLHLLCCCSCSAATITLLLLFTSCPLPLLLLFLALHFFFFCSAFAVALLLLLLFSFSEQCNYTYFVHQFKFELFAPFENIFLLFAVYCFFNFICHIACNFRSLYVSSFRTFFQTCEFRTF